MDAFYASVEQRDNPELRGMPVAVGWDKERSVVCAASYEARKYGVRSAMPSVTARKKCPDLIFVKPHFEVYQKVSKQIRQIFLEYTDLVEPLSLDEAYLDVTENKKNIASATLIASEIKDKIKEVTGLTASAGVSYNKFLAKIASDYQKPNGLFVIKPENAVKFIEDLEIEKFHGIGKVTAQKMHKLGIHKGQDLKKIAENEMVNLFGKHGAYYYGVANGIDERAVIAHRERKSLGTEYTFDKDLTKKFEVIAELYKIEKHLMEMIEKYHYFGKTLTLKVKYADFKQHTRSKTLNIDINNFQILHSVTRDLLKSISFNDNNQKIRLLGLSISNFNCFHAKNEQLVLLL
jgi:DNA polymerase-4